MRLKLHTNATLIQNYMFRTTFCLSPILMFRITHDWIVTWIHGCVPINSTWPSDAIWRQRSRSTLAQVMACCLTAPSHYLNQCWLIIINEVQRHSLGRNVMRDVPTDNSLTLDLNVLKSYGNYLQFQTHNYVSKTLMLYGKFSEREGYWVEILWMLVWNVRGSKKTAKMTKLRAFLQTLQQHREQKSTRVIYPLEYISTLVKFPQISQWINSTDI